MLLAGIARDWREAMDMPADLALCLLDEMRAGSGQTRPSASGIQTMPDGTRKVSFGSMGELAAAVKQMPGSGIRVGR